MGVVTIGGTLCCWGCGGSGTRTMPLHVGEVYECPVCLQLGRWTGHLLTPLPWWWPPSGVSLRPWLDACREVSALCDDDDAPPEPGLRYHALLRLLAPLRPDPPPGVALAR